jgi:hypothetical protein
MIADDRPNASDHSFTNSPVAYCGILFVLTLAVYSNVLHLGFLSIDDSLYVYNNPHVVKGLTWESVKWSFSTVEAEFWHPLTWLSLMLDTTLYGVVPAGYHSTNLFLHLATTILLFVAFDRMTGQRCNSFLLALFFGIHPLHVEAVAWISERKEVLCGIFWSGALLAYGFYSQKPNCICYLVVLVLFFLGIMSKTMIVTLPFVLLLLDYWPLKRHEGKVTCIHPRFIQRLQPAIILVLEKIPFLLLSAFAITITLYAQQSGKGIVGVEIYPLQDRLANAITAYRTYLTQAVIPHHLSIFYPFRFTISLLEIAVSILILTSITSVAIILFKRKPYLVIGWCWFLGSLFPVIGIIKFGDFSMANRFMHMPIIGILIPMVWLVSDLMGLSKQRKALFFLFFSILVAFIGYQTKTYLSKWKTDETLFEHAIQVSSPNFFAHYGLGHLYTGKRFFEAAEKQFQTSIRLRPDKIKIKLDLARSIGSQGRFSDAVACLDEILKSKPDYFDAHYYMGIALAGMGQNREGIQHLLKAIESETIDYLTEVKKRDLIALIESLMEQGNIQQAYLLLGLDPSDKMSEMMIRGVERWEIPKTGLATVNP